MISFTFLVCLFHQYKNFPEIHQFFFTICNKISFKNPIFISIIIYLFISLSVCLSVIIIYLANFCLFDTHKIIIQQPWFNEFVVLLLLFSSLLFCFFFVFCKTSRQWIIISSISNVFFVCLFVFCSISKKPLSMDIWL